MINKTSVRGGNGRSDRAAERTTRKPATQQVAKSALRPRPLANPAVERLFTDAHPLGISAVVNALRAEQPILVDAVPTSLLGALLVLNAVSRELTAKAVVDDSSKLRERVEQEIARPTLLERALLAGATFSAAAPRYPQAATANCEPGEVRLEYLQEGMQFRSCGRVGRLIYRTPSRAVVEYDAAPQERKFLNHKNGEEVTFTSTGARRTGCALDAPVTPVYSQVPAEERAWAVNAWKELTGVYE